MTDETPLAVHDFMRSYPIGDLTVAPDGDGRTVTAFAAVFNRAAEIRDQDGHYNEVLAPDSFKQTIATRGKNFGVFYNHGKTLYGTPSESGSVPIGVPVEVPRVDTVGGVTGLVTVTRYLDNPLADSILDGIKQRAITGQSFTGRFMKSSRARAASRSDLPTITRQEVAMKEYGPTPFPAYAEAGILGTRSVTSFLQELAQIDPDDLERVRNMLGIPTPGPVDAADTPDGAVQPEEPAAGHSLRHNHLRLEWRKRKEGTAA